MARSLLFIPDADGDSLAKALAASADMLILDLRGPADFSGRDDRRKGLRDFIFSARQRQERPRLFVQINGLETDQADRDLDAIMPAAPDGIVLPGSRSGADVQHLGAKLAVHEARNGLRDGACAIVPIVTQTAASLFGLSTYAGSSPRLEGLAWSAQDFSAALGALSDGGSGAAYSAACQLARTLTLVGARAAGVEPIDTAFSAMGDNAGLRRECEAARRDGFTGKMALDPAQVSIINDVFDTQP